MSRGHASNNSKETTSMRRVKLAVIPVAVAVSQLLGPAAANGYFRMK